MSDITGSRAVTNAVLSPNVELQIGTFTIGYARKATETQSRDVTPLYEIGSVGVIEMVPGQPKPVTLALEKVEIYGATLVGLIAQAVASGNLTGVSAAAGLSLADTQKALVNWVTARLGQGSTMADIRTLADMPVGFQCQLNEQSPVDPAKVMISTYQNCWMTSYSRPIQSAGDLTVVAAMNISAQRVTYKDGLLPTQQQVEVVSR